ncbi:MAG: transcription termination factor NusA [Candidatus Ancillula trichonymphae]|jgi:N utilization substance protein A|nr:transcription termination factor NusA [Candidatus Ancillula trichonymphae]
MDIDMSTLRELVQERGIDFDSAVYAVEQALLVAYHKVEGSQKFARVEFDRKTGRVRIWAKKILTADDAESSGEVKHDDELEFSDEFDDTPEDFGRIAASTARQVILQKIRQAEDLRILGNFKDKTGQIVSGIVKPCDVASERAAREAEKKGLHASFFNGLAKLDAGNGIELLLPLSEQVPGEKYEPGVRLRVFVVDVTRGAKGPQIVCSRSHPQLVQKLFELEVPEIEKGTAEIVSIAREAGHRTKIAVKSLEEGFNAKGALIGPVGARVRAVMNELGGEKIDIINWDENPAHYISNALSPSKATGVKIIDHDAKTAHVVVPEYQLSLAIGRDGQNARLAARLTGWKIDIISDALIVDGNKTSEDETTSKEAI